MRLAKLSVLTKVTAAMIAGAGSAHVDPGSPHSGRTGRRQRRAHQPRHALLRLQAFRHPPGRSLITRSTTCSRSSRCSCDRGMSRQGRRRWCPARGTKPHAKSERNCPIEGRPPVFMPSTPFAYPQVISRRFAYFRVVKFHVSAAHEHFWGGFDSRQLHQIHAGHSDKGVEHRSHVKIHVSLLTASGRGTARIAATLAWVPVDNGG
jgi:hypothetical protein